MPMDLRDAALREVVYRSTQPDQPRSVRVARLVLGREGEGLAIVVAGTAGAALANWIHKCFQTLSNVQ